MSVVWTEKAFSRIYDRVNAVGQVCDGVMKAVHVYGKYTSG